MAVSSPRGKSFPIEPSLAAISHRGPDDHGIFVSNDRDCTLGHVRLSIIDLSQAGHQPMPDSSGRYVISYNGEVYNYVELRQSLESRHGLIPWKSGTDTEVIIEGFAREGAPFLERLNGIFALLIYDTQDRLLHALRDPIGIKPLFVTEQQQCQFFASELKGLLVLPFLKRTLRMQSLAEQIAFMYVPEPHTPFHEFEKVEPGTLFIYREGKLVAATPMFSHLHGSPMGGTPDDAAETLGDALGAAVKRQLTADVDVSLFLSGGLDSSAVAYHAVQAGGKIRDAYTIAFAQDDRKHDAQGDDLHYAALMAKRLGLHLNVITASRDFLSLVPELIHFMEDGFSDPAAINTYLICKGARSNGVKVMLSGQGADEYLGGYRRYVAERVLHKTPAALRSAVSRLGQLLPEKLPGRFNALNRRLKRFAHLSSQSPSARMLGMYTWTRPEGISALFLDPPEMSVGEEFQALFDSYNGADIVDVMMNLDHQYDLLSLNLCYTDRMSMAVGVEARVPFLDLELVRVMNSIPVRWKVKGLQGKHVLRSALRSSLPKSVVYREKAGFGLPIRAWMNERNGLFEQFLHKSRLERQGIFNAAAIEKLQIEQFSGVRDHSHTLFTLLLQQMWLDQAAA